MEKENITLELSIYSPLRSPLLKFKRKPLSAVNTNQHVDADTSLLSSSACNNLSTSTSTNQSLKRDASSTLQEARPAKQRRTTHLAAGLATTVDGFDLSEEDVKAKFNDLISGHCFLNTSRVPITAEAAVRLVRADPLYVFVCDRIDQLLRDKPYLFSLTTADLKDLTKKAQFNDFYANTVRDKAMLATMSAGRSKLKNAVCDYLCFLVQVDMACDRAKADFFGSTFSRSEDALVAFSKAFSSYPSEFPAMFAKATGYKFAFSRQDNLSRYLIDSDQPVSEAFRDGTRLHVLLSFMCDMEWNVYRNQHGLSMQKMKDPHVLVTKALSHLKTASSSSAKLREIVDSIEVDDIVYGHRDATLALIWTLLGVQWQEAKERAEKRASSVLIQRQVRKYLARKAFLTLRNNVVKLQSTYRMYTAQKTLKHLKRQLTEKRVTVLQTIFRSRIARRLLQALKRERLELTSATKVQSAFRMHRAQRQLRDLKQHKKCVRSAVKLQSTWRMFVARAELQSLQQAKRELNASLLLQSTFRMHVAKKLLLTLKRHKQELGAATKLQSTFRMHVAKMQLRELRRAKLEHDSAIQIQSVYRMRLAQKQLRSLQQQRKALLAATTLQSSFRMHVAKKQLRVLKQEKQRLLATILVQSVFRMHVAKQELRVLKQQKRELLAATLMQSIFRMHVAKRELRVLKQRKVELLAAILMQSTFRMHVAKQQLRVLKQQKRELLAAIIMQSTYRMHIAKQELRVLKQQKRELLAATLMQSTYRMHRAKLELQVLKQQKRELLAATLMQSVYRMHVAKKQLLALKQERRELLAATLMQSTFRMHVAKKQLRVLKQEKRELLAATLMQSTYRMHRAKLELQVLKQQKRELLAAIIMQSTYRMHVAKQELRVLKQRKLEMDSALLIQCAWKVHLAVKQMQLLKRERKELRSATCIQSTFRMYVARKELVRRKIEHLQQVSATKIQSGYRMFQAKQQLRALRQAKKELTSATLLQSVYRMHVAMMKLRKLKQVQLEMLSAVKLQSTFRMYVSKKQRRELQEQHRMLCACIRIQAVMRMKIAKNTLAGLQQQRRMLLSAITIQSVWRMRVARQQLAMLQQQKLQMQSAIAMQSIYRMYVAKKQLASLKQAKVELLSATKLQSVFRMHVCRATYKKTVSAIVCMQATVRTLIAKRAYKNTVSRIVRAQSYVRRCLAIKEKHFLQHVNSLSHRLERIQRSCAARRIQRVFKARLLRQKQELRAAISVQSWWRGVVCRKSLVKQQHGSRIRMLRARIDEARLRAVQNPTLTLGQRTNSALATLLESKQLSLVLTAIQNLETTVSLSSACAELIVKQQSLPVLVALLQRCNRSTPHISLIKHVLNILLALTTAPNDRVCATIVNDTPELVEMLMELCQMFRDKEAVFVRAAIVLYALSKSQYVGSRRVCSRISDGVRRLRAMGDIMEKRMVVKAKASQPGKGLKQDAKSNTPSLPEVNVRTWMDRCLRGRKDEWTLEEQVAVARAVVGEWEAMQ